MQLPLQITFRNVAHSTAVEARIRTKAAKLAEFYQRIIGCRIAIEALHRYQQGILYYIKIDLTLPGRELVVHRHPNQQIAHEDIYIAICDAFAKARRQLQNYTSRQRSRVKTHTSDYQDLSDRLSTDEDDEFVETNDSEICVTH
ncbi:MAG: HPF/RaiA family ribosome-associated protein [Acidobacteriota bacterium]